jgi:hypothetical protein
MLKMSRATLAAVVVACLPVSAALAESLPPFGSGIGHIVSNVPGNFFDGTNVNNLIGANRFYTNGITGQGTVTANVEAGLPWTGHEALTHISQLSFDAAAFGTTANDLFDRHATWVASHIGGRQTASNGGAWQTGIAPGTDLRAGAIASVWSGTAFTLGFNFTTNSFFGGYTPFFPAADVVNSSWGGTSPAGNTGFAQALDGLAAMNPRTTLVASAGNSGPGANTVGWPGSGYNAITVGALENGGNNAYNTIASFSSRGPQDYADPFRTVLGVRAPIDIVAPGTNLHAAFYGGQTGGNNTTLTGSTNNGTNPNFYTFSVAGTSFASPIVAGGVALLKSASYNTPSLAANPASRDTLVVKSALMNSATKTVGWDNGQILNSAGGVFTTQALDYAAGAGAMNLDRAYDQYVLAGTADVPGTANGDLGTVSPVGWDYGNVTLGGANLYTFADQLEGGTDLTVTLNWFRDRTVNVAALSIADVAQADLTLQVIDLSSFMVISQSASDYNVTEHLSFTLPTTSQYAIRVVYGLNTFGTINNVNYGLAWSGTAVVPEPTLLVGAASLGLLTLRRRRK